MLIPAGVLETIRRALDEDVGPGDITTNLIIPDDQVSKARFLAKSDCILAGFPFALEPFRILDPDVRPTISFPEGSVISAGSVLAEITGKTSAILTAERLALNILQRLCGIATLTHAYAQRIRGLRARVTDTRKTTPGMRFMEKYAVKAGGGLNHRFGLFDGILIKDNHIKAAGGVREAVSRAKKGHHLTKIEVEAGSIEELKEALEVGADMVLLDNMKTDMLREAVLLTGGRVLLEASGGVNLESIRAIAETGVDFISVGALTHSASAADISLKITD